MEPAGGLGYVPDRFTDLPYSPNPNTKPKDIPMLYTIAIILIVLWLLGLVSSTTIGGFIHVLLVIAIVMVLLQVIQGRKLR